MPPELLTAAGSLVGGTLINQLNKRNAIKMQDRINEYNLPINQKRRVEAAGFNPATFYNQQSVENTSAPAQIPDASSGFGSASGTMAAALAARNLQAQNDNLKEQNRVLKAQAKSQELDNQLKEAQLPNELIRQQGIGNVHVSIDSNGDITYGSQYYDEDGNLAYTPIFDKEGKTLPGTGYEMSFNYYRAFQDAIKNGLYVDRDILDNKLKDIEYAIQREYGRSTAAESLRSIRSSINKTDEEAKAIKLDNDIFDSLGVGSKVADGVLRILMGVLLRK